MNTIIKNEIIVELHKTLMSDPPRIDYLKERRGITKDTITKYMIGYDQNTNRYTIPIKDSIGNYVNVRKWKDSTPKMISYGHGYGEGRLYPIENLMNGKNKVLICEGEWDCLLLNQNGINAVTGTTGALSWKEEWNIFFKHFDGILK